jgi:hypothetical protein
MAIERADLDRLQKAYKDAVELWIAAIREEESLATPDHSIRAWERWDHAAFQADAAHETATAAKEAYKDGLRLADYGI